MRRQLLPFVLSLAVARIGKFAERRAAEACFAAGGVPPLKV